MRRKIPSTAALLAFEAEADGRIDATLVKKSSHDWDLAAADLILRLKALETAEINWLIQNYTAGRVADEQMSAMTMAIFKTCSWNIGTPRVRSSVGCSCASM